jgi:TP901 family phage tail tape measure protein
VAISEQIEVSVSGLGEVDDLAGALDKASEAAGKLKDELASMGGGAVSSAGADKFAAAWDAAAGKVSDSVGKISAAMGKLDDLGATAGAAGPDKLVASWDTAAASIGASVDKIAAAGAKLDDVGAGAGAAADEVKGLGAAGDAAAAGLGKASDAAKGLGDSAGGLTGLGDGLKGLGGDADALAAEIAAAGAELDKLLAKGDALSARGAVSAASASSLNAKVDSSGFLATASVEQDAARTQASRQAVANAEAAEASAGRYHMLALGGAAALAYGVDKAAQLQTSVTRLYTTAGESAANLPMMSAGILKLSGETNTSQAQLGAGAYMAESAGFHGQSALNVLKAAAQGAQAEGAPLSETTNALTSLLNAYGMKGAGAPMQAMDEIISMVSRGKMTMSSAVSALPNVLPAASAAKLSFADVGGALSTMTSMGVSPDRAAQNLSHVITSIMNPNAVQTKEQQQLGLNPVQLQNDLSKQGLTGTLTELSSTVMKNMGPAGDVLFKTFNQSRSAAADANKMISAMPASIRGLAQSYADGKVSVAQWNQEMFKGSESTQQKNLLQQFATTENSARGFNNLLKSGSPDVQTYAAAMDKLLGGQTGLNVAMELTGQHMPVMKANTDAIAASAQHAGANVQGWSKVQSTLNFQLGSFVKTSEAVATEAGQTILPTLTTAMKGLSSVGGFLASNPEITKPLVAGAGILGGAAVAGKVVSAGTTAVASVGKLAETLHIPGLDKLANIGQGSGLDTAGAGLKSSAADLSGSAADLSAAAEKLSTGTPGGPLGTPAKTDAENTAKTDVETGAEEGGGFLGLGAMAKGLGGAASPILAGVLAAELVRGVGDNMAPKGTPAGKLNQYLQSDKAPGNLFVNREAGGFESAAAMSGVGLDVGGFLNKLLGIGTAHPAGTTQQSQFQSRFGISEPGSTGPAPAAPPLAATPPKYQTMTDTIGMAMATTVPQKAAAPSSSFNSALAQAMGKPVKVPPPDISSFKGDGQKAGADFNSALASAMGKPVKVAPPDLGPFAAAKGPARADGVGVSAGLAQGIEAGKAAAVSAAESVAGAVATAMSSKLDSHSPSKVTEKIGKDAVAGLVLGLQGGQDAVNSAATALGKNVAKAADITSIDSTVAKLKTDVKGNTGLVKWLGEQQTKLTVMANQRQKLETEIADSEQIAQQAISNSSILNAASYTPSLAAAGGPQSSYATVSGLQSMLADQKQFTAQIGKLQKEGLNATSVNQLVQGGASAGLPVTAGLVGNKGAISQINQLESQLHAQAAKLGDEGGTAMYAAGAQAAQGLAQGLKSQLGSLDSSMSKLADVLVDRVKKDLKISSPSQVFADLGFQIPAGVARGVDDGSVMASSAVGRMAGAASGAFRPSIGAYHGGGGYGSGSGGGGGTVHNHFNVTLNVQGSVMAEHELVSTVQQGLLVRAANNWQSGVILPGRAG